MGKAKSSKNAGEKTASYKDTIVKVVGGSTRGSEFPARGASFTIGRSTDADVQIQDTQISRVHCRLDWKDGLWHIEDLDSTNGTWMVGQRVDRKVQLPLKASVRVGNTIFELYDIYSSEEAPDSRQPVITYRIEPETLACSGEDNSKTLQVVKEESRRLAAIYKFYNLISSVFDERELYGKILSAVTNIIPSDDAYLLLYSITAGDFAPVAGRTDHGVMEKIESRNINQKVVSFVKDTREAILSTSSFDGGVNTKKIPGLPELTTSVMCVPMLGKQQINGMIYISLSSAAERYSENDLRLLTVIGHTAGMAIENSRLVAHSIRNERLLAAGATAANLSHHIKNIMTGLDGSINLLSMAVDNSDMGLAKEAAGILRKNHRRVEELALDLLNLSSEQKPKFKKYDVGMVIKDVVELFDARLKQDKINIRVAAAVAKQPLYADVDAKGIHRVLLNLIGNAQQAILDHLDKLDERPGEITIAAAFTDAKESVTVTVTDNGGALSPDNAESIFDLFVSDKGYVGTGLGLAVSKKIIEAHDGSIAAKTDKEGKLTSISFTIPASHSEQSTATCSFQRINVT